MGYYRSAYDNSPLGGCMGEIINIPIGIVFALIFIVVIHLMDRYGLPTWLRGIIGLTLLGVFGYALYHINKYFQKNRDDKSDNKNA